MNLEKALNSPKARHTDPLTAHEAAELITHDGTLLNALCIVFIALRNYPNTTSRELAERAGLERHDVARRLPELRVAGVVEMAGKKRCTVGNLNAMSWRVTAPEIDAAQVQQIITDARREARRLERIKP